MVKSKEQRLGGGLDAANGRAQANRKESGQIDSRTRGRATSAVRGYGVVITAELRNSVIDLLTICEKGGLKFQRVDLDDETGEVFDIYAAVLADEGLGGPDVDRIRVELVRNETEFPSPKVVADYARRGKVRYDAAELRRSLDRLVTAIGPGGEKVLADPERVRAGVLLPAGDKSGDGSPAPAALPRNLDKELADLRKALEASRDPDERGRLELRISKAIGVRALMRDVTGPDRGGRRPGLKQLGR